MNNAASSSATQSDLESYLSFMNSMEKKMEEKMKEKEKVTEPCPTLPCKYWSIYKVPGPLRELKEDAYTPRIVSIGPFHSGQVKLQAMEAHKTQYMESLFQRTTDPKQTRSDCAEAILSMEERARQCYSEHQPSGNFRNGKLAKILLLDGCFILEVLLRWRTSGNNSNANTTTDPIFGSARMINSLQRDVVLLENQIPFFVLQRLFDLTVGRVPNRKNFTLLQLCIPFHLALNLSVQASQNNGAVLNVRASQTNGAVLNVQASQNNGAILNVPASQNNGAVRHFLDAIRNHYLPSSPKIKPIGDRSWESIHCATKLRESGIKFVRGSPERLFDIRFNSTKGVLNIPLLLIQDATESLLRNLVAFEQCCHGTSHVITSYIMLIDRLIDSPQDAEYLEKKRIIANLLGSGEDVSELFNNMFKEVVLDDFFFQALCEEVNIYYNRRWPRYKAFLARNHCSNPWRIMAVFAAFVLIVLAAVQTGYTVAGYYPH